jgi:molybdopterin molybdotransferase
MWQMAQNLITIAEARRRVLASTSPLDTELVTVADAVERVLAEDIRAAGNTPPFPSSAMDGYAIEPGPAQRELEVVGESRAGAPAAEPLPPGRAIRISTGAAVPEGADAVIRQEDVVARDGHIITTTEVAPGQNVRRAGEDMAAGTTVLSRGMRIGPPELAAAVAAGAGQLRVSVRPRVAVFATGDELREPGQELAPGQIHNSNGPMLAALARAAGARAPEPARLADDLGATTSALAQALEASDVILISGGVSVGPHDHVKPALRALSVDERFWGVSLQPGKPTWFGTQGEKLVFGLPGNPVSAYVTFVLFAMPALAAMQGAPTDRPRRHAVLGVPVVRNPHREQAVRVRLEDRDGVPTAVPNGPQGSHIVTSLVGADALALIPPGPDDMPAGEPVEVLALRG